jgi:hypothetical protein
VELGEGDMGGFEGGLDGVGKPNVQAVEENCGDVDPEEMNSYWMGKFLDWKFIANVSGPCPGFAS